MNKKNINYFSIKNILIFWGVVILLGLILGGNDLALGLLIAALISIVIMQYTLNSSWEGIIDKIKTEKVYERGLDENDHGHYKEITYAYIKLNNGKTKKIQNYPYWKEGDKIKKEKGKVAPEKIK